MEISFLNWLRPRIPAHPQVLVGVGDDAAVLAATPGRAWVVTTDTLTEGVDFRLAVDEPRRIGRKALAVNLSDLAAMAATPIAAFASLVLPRSNAASVAREVTLGMLDLAGDFGLSLAGGDTNTWGDGLVISVTVLGETTSRGPLLRSGGRIGDAVLATGRFGGSLLGRQFDFVPRVREALRLHADFDLHAAIDVSDGLSLDLFRLAEASECGAEIDPRAIPIAPAAYLMSREGGSGKTPLEHALSDGEDFELLLAVGQAEADRLLRSQPLETPVRQIGRLVATRGLWQSREAGPPLPLTPAGYEHHGAQEPGP